MPPVQVFTPQNYGAEDQNWAITQSQNDFIYIANNKGLLEYNGASWKLYDSPGDDILRSIHVVNDMIYTGGYMDFGYWVKDRFGNLVYTSLTNNKDVKVSEDEEFWGILDIQGYVVFQSFHNIYIYNTLDKNINVINSKSRINKMFKVNETIYFQKSEVGIFKIENGKATLVISSDTIKNKEVINIYKSQNELLLLTKSNGFFKFQTNEIKKWNIDADRSLANKDVYSSIKLKDGSFVLGTISNGIIIIDSNGSLLLTADQSYGLSNNTILSIKEDNDGNVWLGLDNGINVLNLNSPYRVYLDKQGVLGTVYTSLKTTKFLYLGTNQGLFYKVLGTDSKFKFVSGTKGQVWSLEHIHNTLFCGHDKGTFVINDSRARLISEEKGTWDLKEVSDQPNLLIQGNYKGLNILEKDGNGSWSFRNRIEGFDISSRYFEFIDASELLISHEYKGVFKLKLNKALTKVIEFKTLGIDKGKSSSIINYNKKLRYVYDNSIFNYNKNNNTFSRDTVLRNLFANNNYVSGKLINDKEGNRLWSFSDDQLLYIERGKLTDKPELNSISLSSQARKSKKGFENILFLGGDNYLLGTTEGYIVIDLNKVEDRTHKIELNTVSYNSLHEKMIPLELSKHADLKNKDHNIHFTYSVADFNKFSSSLYQYRLLGIYNDWSPWSNNSEILFENLPSGDYKFEARAKVGGDISVNTVSYSFNIEKPWYLKPLAIALYVLAFLFLGALTQYLNSRYYKKQKKKLLEKKERELELEQLESQRQVMEFKNKNLHLDIENKNRELGMATMNLVKRNELLNNIKEELTKSKSLNEVKNVIQLINSSLNNTSDWKLFEEAFNNVDKDFMKKIKSMHPSITTNDLRLCAYLRLNLSSKEIAPLLNISHKSVEVKRYRLRKKMGLDHDQSLSDYIIDL